ncbi:MAG TPA: hypothetical protein VEY87_13475 [Gaiellaceae bacterium]|nr:hypothetical protein [Gaiellaceae bacterium]
MAKRARLLTGLRGLALVAAAAVAAAVPATGSASELIDRNAAKVQLQVDGGGQALLSYTARGKRWNVLAWGAVNALHPTTARPQVKFRLDYSGGWGTYQRDVWKTFRNGCKPYDGPKLQWLVAACTAPDGSYWAVQSWQRMLPNYGVSPDADGSVWELRLSHWKGDLPVLTIHQNWAYKKYHHLLGSFTYLGRPVHGFKATSTGVPLDTFGRNLYVDTFNSAYGNGWKRENSFLMHKGSGKFCYGFYGHTWAGKRHPSGMGQRYRATIIGPGVLPDVYWDSEAPGAYDLAFDLEMHAFQKQFYTDTNACKPV